MLRASLRALHISAVANARAGGSVAPKAMGKNVYAVVTGRRPGLYTKWEDCLLQVKGFPGNRYKGFSDEHEALRYLQENGVTLPGMAATAAAAVKDWDASVAGRRAPAAGAAAPRKRRMPDSSKPFYEQRWQRQQPSAAPTAAAAARGVAAMAGGPFTALPTSDRVLRLEFDGASKRNPGPAGFGAVLYDDATGEEVARLCQYMGDAHTNNQAEYAGLIAGLQAALQLGCSRIRVFGDSTLIIRQVMGEWRVKNQELQRYHAAADALRRRFVSFEAQQVRREYNKVADALSNQAISDYRSGVNPHLWRLDEAVAAANAAAAELEWGGEGAGAGDGGTADPWSSDAAAKRPRWE